jgi:hypothetical protein
MAHRNEYDEIIGSLISECRRRGIYILVNKRDPGYEENNEFAVVYQKAVLRYIWDRAGYGRTVSISNQRHIVSMHLAPAIGGSF